jgi:hypothetical protein
MRVAEFLLYDETFPKMSKRLYSLGVAICKNGLIRSLCWFSKPFRQATKAFAS